MTTRVNGGFAAGQWTAGELWYFVITVGGGADLTLNAGEPNAQDELLYEALAQVSTPVIMRVENATTAHIALAYAAETTAATISARIDAVFKAMNGSWTAVAVSGAFTIV